MHFVLPHVTDNVAFLFGYVKDQLQSHLFVFVCFFACHTMILSVICGRTGRDCILVYLVLLSILWSGKIKIKKNYSLYIPVNGLLQ